MVPGPGDVVGVARPGPSAGSSWAGKEMPLVQGVAGLVDDERGRAGGGGEPDAGAGRRDRSRGTAAIESQQCTLLQRRQAPPAAAAAPSAPRCPARACARPAGRPPRGPAAAEPGRAAARARWWAAVNPCRPPAGSPAGQPRSASGNRAASGSVGRARRRRRRGALSARVERWAERSSARRAAARSATSSGSVSARAGQRHHVDRARPSGSAGERVLPEVDQRRHHVALARRDAVQRRDRVDGGAAGGQLVVDEHQRARPGQQGGIGRQQQVSVWWECSSANAPAAANPRTGRRVECR